MTATLERTDDGFSRRAEGPGVKVRVVRARWFIMGAILVLILGSVAYAQRADNDYVTLSIKNYDPNGARALAEVAHDQGVRMRQIESLSDARITDPATTTLVIASGEELQPFQARTIADLPRRHRGDWPKPGAVGGLGPVDQPQPRSHGCELGQVRSTGRESSRDHLHLRCRVWRIVVRERPTLLSPGRWCGGGCSVP